MRAAFAARANARKDPFPPRGGGRSGVVGELQDGLPSLQPRQERGVVHSGLRWKDQDPVFEQG